MGCSLGLSCVQITSFQTSLPLVLQAHMAAGYFVCFIAMLAIYHTNAWGAKSLPFMSTRMLLPDGSKYPITKIFKGGILNAKALAEYGLPSITGTFAYGLLVGNAAVCWELHAGPSEFIDADRD